MTRQFHDSSDRRIVHRRVILQAAAVPVLAVAFTACGKSVPSPTSPPSPTEKGPSMPEPTTADLAVLERLRDAIDSHDPNRVAACFTDDYRSELPHHPDRNFTGTDQVRRNWTAMFAGVPDITASIVRTATNGPEIWSEWELTGTDVTGEPVAFAGPVVLTARAGRISWTRFYLDRVETTRN
jgi:ketosteroid isomerase-like protein